MSKKKQNPESEEIKSGSDTPETEEQETGTSDEESSEESSTSEVEQLKKELEDLKDRYYRALADYQNLQRRSAKEILEARARGVEDFVKKLLPVIDTMEKAIEQISNSNVDKKVIDGLEMFSIQFTDVLEKEGLKAIPAKGKKFDPNFHEAMCKRSVEGIEDEIVLNEFEKGYTFKDRVLRTAKVEINQH
ncbi:MAG: nucleotide exchange factor GrpE [Candidatus Rifleibacteriota bacterium]